MKISRKKNKMAKVFFGLLIVSSFFLETLSAETRYRVKSSDNLNTIVERFYKDSGLAKSQLLVGVLAKNPSAFKGGNVNFLLRGKRLVLPDERELQQISPEKASEILSEHVHFFRSGITGDLIPPNFTDLVLEQEDPSKILAKQKIQTQKLEQLQQESTALKKQLEVLMREKNDRDQRLIELEESLKKALEATKKSNLEVVSTKELEEASKKLQKKININKGELAEHTKLNKALEQQVGSNLREASGDDNNNNAEEVTNIRSSIFSSLFWVFPLVLFIGLILYLFRKKKKQAIDSDDKIEVSESGYIEPYGERVLGNEMATEEEPLETSVKLDVARAYIEAEDTQSALDILSEIMAEGSDEQRKVAHELLESISPS